MTRFILEGEIEDLTGPTEALVDLSRIVITPTNTTLKVTVTGESTMLRPYEQAEFQMQVVVAPLQMRIIDAPRVTIHEM